MADTSLSIISVYHSWMSKRLLELNWDLTHHLNPDEPFVWFAADNTPRGNTPEIDKGKFITIRNTGIHAYHGMVSPHHASGINTCLPYVKTRFLLSLDNDLYIVRPRWISEVVDHMQKNDLAFFGVPWHVKDWVKYRHFPAVQGLFVDLDKVDLATLDFSPDLRFKNQFEVVNERKNYERAVKEKNKKSKLYGTLKSSLPAPISQSFGRLVRTLDVARRRKNIGIGRDTGYGVYRRYGNDMRFKREIVQTVYEPYTDGLLRKQINLPLNTVIEHILPERLCYFPKQKNYFSTSGFASKGYPSAAASQWEEFLWQDEPFAINVHGSPSKTKKRHSTPEEEVAHVQSIVEQISAHAKNTNA